MGGAKSMKYILIINSCNAIIRQRRESCGKASSVIGPDKDKLQNELRQVL